MTERILSVDETIKLASLSRSTIWRLEARGEFPSKRMLGARRIGYLLSEIVEWMNTRGKKI